MRRRPFKRVNAIARNPHVHKPASTTSLQSALGSLNGWEKTSPTGVIAKPRAGVAIGAATLCATGAQAKWRPRLINNEKGTKNLNDALNHNQ